MYRSFNIRSRDLHQAVQFFEYSTVRLDTMAHDATSLPTLLPVSIRTSVCMHAYTHVLLGYAFSPTYYIRLRKTAHEDLHMLHNNKCSTWITAEEVCCAHYRGYSSIENSTTAEAMQRHQSGGRQGCYVKESSTGELQMRQCGTNQLAHAPLTMLCIPLVPHPLMYTDTH